MKMFYKRLIVFMFYIYFCNTQEDKKTQKVSQGKDAKWEDFPCMTHIIVNFGNEQYTCGGCMIAANLILTAAQCVEYNTHPGYQSTQVVTCDLCKNKFSVTGQFSYLSNYAIHPKRNKFKRLYNVGLIQVYPSFSITEECYPLNIAKWDEVCGSNGCFYNMTCKTAGWGKTQYGSSKILQYINLTLKKSKCREKMKHWKEETDICILENESESDPELQEGDIGGPIICEVNTYLGKVRKLAGIISHSTYEYEEKGCNDLSANVGNKLYNNEISEWILLNLNRGFLSSAVQVSSINFYKIIICIYATFILNLIVTKRIF